MRDRDRRFTQLAAVAERQLGLFTFRQAVEAGFPEGHHRGPRPLRPVGTRPASRLPGSRDATFTSGEPRGRLARLRRTGGDLRSRGGGHLGPRGATTRDAHDHRPLATARAAPRRGRHADATVVVHRDGPAGIRPAHQPDADAARPRTPPRGAPPRARPGRVPLEVALDGAHRRRLVHIVRFDVYLDEAVRRRIPGASDLRHLVRLRDPERPNDSGGETKLLHRLRSARLPLPVYRHWIRTRRGTRRIDLAYPNQKVALEVDSYAWHDGRVRHDDDRARDNELADAGWERRHITTTMLDDPAPTVELTVATALGLRPRGWRPGS